jgi:hypothetical protein
LATVGGLHEVAANEQKTSLKFQNCLYSDMFTFLENPLADGNMRGISCHSPCRMTGGIAHPAHSGQTGDCALY